MNKNVHIVPHMHWDREWYFTAEESRILLVNNMEEILDMLENDPDYPYYVMDGQTAILEDYFAIKPENKSRIEKLVREGKLIIGPWYTQTDEMVVGAESIVRNLLYGLKDCEPFGEAMKIGYLPDSFGQSAQMPQILNGFDIKHSMFWRGTSERHGTNKTEFHWQSDDGSEVLVQILPLGYAIGKYLPTDHGELAKRMEKYFPVLDRGTTTNHVVLPNGHDQMPVQKNIHEVIKELKALYPDRDFFLSRFENVFDQVEKIEDLATIKGEFLDGKYMRVHRSIFSTRMDIKAANARIESKITNILEPLASIAYTLGFEYHHGLIEHIWKEIMKNHAHDSIGCCCSDPVHREIMARFELAEDKVDELIRFYKRRIADGMSTEITLDKLVAYNLMPHVRNDKVRTTVITKMTGFDLFDENDVQLDFEVIHAEEIDAGLIDRQIVHYGNYDPFMKYTIEFSDALPSMGYKTYFIKEGQKLEVKPLEACDKVDNDFYTIEVNRNGSLKVTDKRLGKTFDQVLLLENEGDDGDEYDFSPLTDRNPIFSSDVEAKTSIVQNKFGAEISIAYEMQLPSDLEARKNGLADTRFGVQINVIVPNDRPIMEVSMTLENASKDHRVRAYLPTGIASKFSVSDNQFGSITRSVVDEAMAVWEAEGWNERPDAIYPMLTYVGVSDDAHGLAVLTNSTREFEIVGDDFDTIAITLFRSVGVIGREELVRRPGRPSGIKMPTPDSQMLGRVSLDFAVVTHANSTLEANVPSMAKAYLTPVVTYNKMPYNAMKLNEVTFHVPYGYSLMSLENSKTVLSVLKKSEKQDALVLRCFNAGTDTVESAWSLEEGFKRAYKANMNEVILEDVAINSANTLKQTVLRNQAITTVISR